MSTLIFREDPDQFTTPIPDSFITDHMLSANGVYVKVYLYVFYAYYHHISDFSLAKAAKELNILESEVLEALRHWNASGALLLSYNKTEDIYRVSFSSSKGDPVPTDPTPGKGNSRKTPKPAPSKVIRVEQPPVYSNEEMELYKRNPEIAALFYQVSHILGMQLSSASMGKVFSLYDYYRLPVEVVLYLVKYCVERDKRDLRYIEKVAMDWSDNNIHSLEAAEEYVHRFDRYVPILRALHCSSTIPTEDQAKYIDLWLDEYGMNMDVLIEAAVRTYERTHRAQFSYTKKIVDSWHEAGITTMQGVSKEDALFQSKAPAVAQKKNSYKDNQFIPSNEYDYDDILEQHRRRLYEQHDQLKEN